MISLASTKDKWLASKGSYNEAKGQNFQTKLLETRVVQSESSQRADTTNVNRIANSLMEKLSQCNEMFPKLQEMTNKHVEKYTGLFPEYRNLKPREKGNKISNRMLKQRRKNTRSRRNKVQLEANKKIHQKPLKQIINRKPDKFTG